MGVWDHWSAHAERTPHREAVVHWTAGKPPVRWLWGSLLQTALGLAAQLQARGVRERDVCAIIFRHHPLFYPLYMAVCALGAVPAVLAFPSARLHPDKFREGLVGMSRRSGLDWLLTERELEPVLAPLLRGDSTIRGTSFPMEWSEESPAPPLSAGAVAAPDSPCLLQHSSGTTGLQKAVVLSHRAVLEHVRRYASAIQLTADDRIVSWLPLYHDMGLIAAFYLPLTLGIPLVQMDAFEWVAAPALFVQVLSEEKGTLAWLPNFAYDLMAQRVRDDNVSGARLDGVRMLVNCSEAVRAGSHARFARRFEPLGLRREALAACYAMAETTFAATQTAPGAAARELLVDRAELAQGRVVKTADHTVARACVSSGAPIAGVELRVVDEHGVDLPDGHVGEIVIRSVSLFDGYRNNPELSQTVLTNGWYRSGDYGFADAGEYFIVGRKKDLLIIAGKSVYPEDVEDAVASVAGVLPGRVVAFSIDDEAQGTEQICVIAETLAADERQRRALCLEIRREGMRMDVTIARIYLASSRWLIKSSSGKPSRKSNMERALRELSYL